MRAITSVSLATVIAATVLSATSTAAHAQVALPPPPRFGAVGQVLVTSELALDYQRDVTDPPGAAAVTTTTYDLHAGFDRVVWRQLTLGLRLGFAGELQGEDERKGFDIGGRVGGLVPAGGSRVWWPSVGLTYGLTSFASRSSAETVRTVTLVLAGPMLWQPARHLLIGVGPIYTRDLQAKTGPAADQTGPATSGFGIHGFLGLWF